MTDRCVKEIIWPTLSGCWQMIYCWAVGPHEMHTDGNGAPLGTDTDVAWMAEQHRLCTAR